MRNPVQIFRRLRQRAAERRRQARFWRSLRHLHGPKQLDAAPDAVLAIVVVRNGSYYMDAFFDHYRAMGIQHFAFIDNGSTDDTISRIMAEPGTILDQCALPLGQYEDLIRQYPAQTYGKGRWCLYVDMDELFDFEGRRQIGLSGLIRYLQDQGANAMVAQMLEMFPKQPLCDVRALSYDQVIDSFSYFDISAIAKYDYHSGQIPFCGLLKGNSIANHKIKFFFGGIRGKVFGETCCLTKHPLIFNGPGVVPGVHPHVSLGLRCADISGVIKHYKFAGDVTARDAETISAGVLTHGEDAARAAVMAQSPDLSLFSLDARPWNRVELLSRAGFTVTTPRYSAFLKEAAQ